MQKNKYFLSFFNQNNSIKKLLFPMKLSIKLIIPMLIIFLTIIETKNQA